MQSAQQPPKFNDIPSISEEPESGGATKSHSEAFREYQSRLSLGFTRVLDETLETLENRVALLSAIRSDPALLLRVGARMMNDAQGLIKPENWEANWKHLKNFSAETETAINENDPVKLGELAGVAFMAALGTKRMGGIDLPRHGHMPDMHQESGHSHMAHTEPNADTSKARERGVAPGSYEHLIQSIKEWEIKNGSPENIEEWLRMHDEIDAEMPSPPRKPDLTMPQENHTDASAKVPDPRLDGTSAYTTSALLAATVYAIWHDTSGHQHLAELASAYTEFANSPAQEMLASYRKTIAKHPELKEAVTAYKSIRESLSSDGTTTMQEQQVLELVSNATKASILNGELGTLSANPFHNRQIRENEIFMPGEEEQGR